VPHLVDIWELISSYDLTKSFVAETGIMACIVIALGFWGVAGGSYCLGEFTLIDRVVLASFGQAVDVIPYDARNACEKPRKLMQKRCRSCPAVLSLQILR